MKTNPGTQFSTTNGTKFKIGKILYDALCEKANRFEGATGAAVGLDPKGYFLTKELFKKTYPNKTFRAKGWITDEVKEIHLWTRVGRCYALESNVDYNLLDMNNNPPYGFDNELFDIIKPLDPTPEKTHILIIEEKGYLSKHAIVQTSPPCVNLH